MGSLLAKQKTKLAICFNGTICLSGVRCYKISNLVLKSHTTRTQKNNEYLHELINKYGLSEFTSKYPHHLSGGMRQRVALIRTLVLRPEILLLDEPFGALDYQTRKTVIQDVSSIITREQKTSILVTHDLSEAASLSDRIIVLSKRPSVVKAVFKTNLRSIPVIEDRKRTDEYKKVVDEIWKELEN